MIEIFQSNWLDFLYIIIGLVFLLGVGGTFFAFSLSYISQKVAMWIDVRKIVLHRNGLMEDNKRLELNVTRLEALLANNGSNDVLAPSDIGVKQG